MRFDGTLQSWNDERGFGFIAPAQGGQEIFVHVKAFPPGTGRPAIGLALSFELELGPNGKKRAKAIAFVRAEARRDNRRVNSPATWSLQRLLVIPLFLAVVAYVATKWSVRPAVAGVYALGSLAAFVAYALDKSAARNRRWRVAESTLHALSLAGGWPGALVAQQLLRHKTSKSSFVAVYWATVVCNIAGFVAVHSPLAAAIRM